ncbi:hypothetical protein Q7P35_008962 [Cladosporium inversicolor]
MAAAQAAQQTNTPLPSARLQPGRQLAPNNGQPIVGGVPPGQVPPILHNHHIPMPPPVPYNPAYHAQVGEEWHMFGAWRRNAIDFYEASTQRDSRRLRELEQTHHEERLKRRDAEVATRAVQAYRIHHEEPQPPIREIVKSTGRAEQSDCPGEVEPADLKTQKQTMTMPKEDADVLQSKRELYAVTTPRRYELLPVMGSVTEMRHTSKASVDRGDSTDVLAIIEDVEEASCGLLTRICREANARDGRYEYRVADAWLAGKGEWTLRMRWWIWPKVKKHHSYFVVLEGTPKVEEQQVGSPHQIPQYGIPPYPIQQQSQSQQQQQQQQQQQYHQIQQLHLQVTQLQNQLARRDAWPVSRRFSLDSASLTYARSLVVGDVPEIQVSGVATTPVPTLQVTTKAAGTLETVQSDSKETDVASRPEQSDTPMQENVQSDSKESDDVSRPCQSERPVQEDRTALACMTSSDDNGDK